MFNWIGPRKGTPAPPGAVTRDLRGDDWHVQLDLTPQVLSLAIDSEAAVEPGKQLMPTSSRWSPEDRVFIGSPESFVSASMLAMKAKLFDDGLCAGVELASQDAKGKLLASLASVSPVVAAAARLGGLDAPASIKAQEVTNAFLADEFKSKPLGFYTWSDPLRRIFQQDRLLQQPLTETDAAALAAALSADPSVATTYGDLLELAARLTNPFPDAIRDLRRPGGNCFFRPSRSHEAEIVRGLYGDRPIPDGFSLADEMIARIRDGSLSLAPTAQSGWYDWQTWCLEPLAIPETMPEASRLRMNARYRKQLEELFKATVAMARETHVKQLEHVDLAAAMPWRPRKVIVHIRPELTVEPLPAFYERRAQAYEFVRGVLERAGLLTGARRQSPDGPVERSLDEELDGMIALFRGAAAVSREELGIEAATGCEAARFREWAKAPELYEDIRMMVPVFYDIQRAKTKVWAILGWSIRRLTMEFVGKPAARIIEGDVRIEYGSSSEDLVHPVFAEVYVSRLLDRDEFRAHCDRYRTPERILANL